MNIVTLTGNCTRDCELRYTQSGKAVANFTLAVTDKFNREQTDFIDCVVWGKLAETCGTYLLKGKKAGVVGRMKPRSYEGQDGQKRKVTEVVVDEVEFLSPKSASSSPYPKDEWDGIGETVGTDDTIPF